VRNDKTDTWKSLVAMVEEETDPEKLRKLLADFRRLKREQQEATKSA
jgi:hypothetical protein